MALQVLLDARAQAQQTARSGAELADKLEQVLIQAEPASGYLSMLLARPKQREIARSAVTELRSLMATTGRTRPPESRWSLRFPSVGDPAEGSNLRTPREHHAAATTESAQG